MRGGQGGGQRLHEDGTKREGPLFHCTDVALKVKGSVAFWASSIAPRRSRTSVPMGTSDITQSPSW